MNCDNQQNRKYLRLFIYRKTHVEILRERDRIQYEKNRKILIKCGCGSEFKKHSLSSHVRSAKHLEFLERKIMQWCITEN